MELYLIHSRPKATAACHKNGAEKQFSCQIQSLCGCQGQKCQSKSRTCSSSLGGLSQGPADSRWETSLHPCTAPVPSSNPNMTSGAAGWTTWLIQPFPYISQGRSMSGFVPCCPALAPSKGRLSLQRNLLGHYLGILESSKGPDIWQQLQGFFRKQDV